MKHTVIKLALVMGLTLAMPHVQATTITSVAPPPDLFDPGNACLIVGTPSSPGVTDITQYILRTPDQQRSLTMFDAFPAGSFNSQAGITIILGPRYSHQASKISALGLTVGNLGALNNWNPKIFEGVIGINSPDVLAFGDRSFMQSVGIAGSPVQFYVETYDHTGIYANQFLSDAGLANGYRLGFLIEPKAPRGGSSSHVPEDGSTLLLLGVGLVAVVSATRKSKTGLLEAAEQGMPLFRLSSLVLALRSARPAGTGSIRRLASLSAA
jgi:hypothetical protein